MRATRRIFATRGEVILSTFLAVLGCAGTVGGETTGDQIRFGSGGVHRIKDRERAYVCGSVSAFDRYENRLFTLTKDEK